MFKFGDRIQHTGPCTYRAVYLADVPMEGVYLVWLVPPNEPALFYRNGEVVRWVVGLEKWRKVKSYTPSHS